VHQLVNKKNFGNIEMHGTTAKNKKKEHHFVFTLDTIMITFRDNERD